MFVHQLQLSTLAVGDLVIATAGRGPAIYIYQFNVLVAGEKPVCALRQIRPDGYIRGPHRVTLEGTGIWTTRDQNPVQSFSPEKQMSTVWGSLYVGGFIIGAAEREFFQLLPAVNEIDVETTITCLIGRKLAA